MLIFQINENELKNELTSKDWLFWNSYLAGRTQENDYVLLPSFINFVQDTNTPCGNQYLLELEDEDDNEDDCVT